MGNKFYLNELTLPFIMELVFLKLRRRKDEVSLSQLCSEEDFAKIDTNLLFSDLNKAFQFKTADETEWHSYDGIPYNEFRNTQIKISDFKIINTFLSEYISDFRNNRLLSRQNYYSYEKHMELFSSMLAKDFEDFGGKNIFLKISDYKDEHYCMPEVLQSLDFDGFITIFYVFYKEKPMESNFPSEEGDFIYEVRFNKTPAEISDIYKYWIYYGDVRVNEKNGIAKYKKNTYTYKSLDGNAFKILCYLIKNHGREVPLLELFKELGIETKKNAVGEPYAKELKVKAKDYVQDIKKNLGIKTDAEPTLDIIVSGDSIALISNPPRK